MRFDLSDDQHEIKRTARELLASRSSWAKVRDAAEAGNPDEALWNELRELGWPGIAIGEEHGGQGLGVVDLAVLLEELGYACAVTPFLGTVLAALAIDAAGSDEQKASWLPRLASGEVRGAFGAVDFVVDAPGADVVVLHVDDDLVLVEDPDVAELDTIDPTRAYGAVPDSAGSRLAGDAGPALARAATAVAAELTGISQRALDMSLEYVKDRKQFGVPVGVFQAVQHTAAQMLRDTEGARSATYYAAWAADADPDKLPVAAAMAKAAASEAGRATTAGAIQLHGGIGFTWEADVHWLFKRAQMDSAFLGGASEHRAEIARLVGEGRAMAGAR